MRSLCGVGRAHGLHPLNAKASWVMAGMLAAPPIRASRLRLVPDLRKQRAVEACICHILHSAVHALAPRLRNVFAAHCCPMTVSVIVGAYLPDDPRVARVRHGIALRKVAPPRRAAGSCHRSLRTPQSTHSVQL